ncbi:MAG TPA: M56 family metallopeptidase [Verrucomicrobiae bacterium]|jgi:beta-lactamase regulating signal transducer with metallopeptidase domain|nr:M56 family metallopeptidase [Verrucomicrobiae bacterium]
MNEWVDVLNHWGGNFWGFAQSMLWQSSLLIVVIFAFDLMFARGIRPAVRCALWLVVLVKLILPPTLALPTGATWWLWRAHPAVESPVIRNYSVSFGNAMPDTVSLPKISVAVPPPELSGDALILLAVVAIGAGLLLWLAFRWLRVAGKVRRAANAPTELDGLLEEVRQMAGLRRRPRLKLIEEAQSPAVYGLWRPIILLPRTLLNQISGRQLRAVLLHEAVHLRRSDVWVNFVQTLLQIAYWWHPLLWIANARIRRLREEAVDDAVMLALRDGADAYAPTLLEVAKFAFRRPLASLGLVGILESRSALRQRVERLVDFRPPRRAGVTFLSLCGIFAFCAVALPMGQGPATELSTTAVGTNPAKGIDLVRKSQALFRVLNGTHLDVSYTNTPLDEVLWDLTEQTRQRNPDMQGISFGFRPPGSDPLRASMIRLTLTLTNASLTSISEEICRHCDHHVNYAVTDKGIVFSEGPYCEMRSFKLGTNLFLTNLRELADAPISTSDMNVTSFLTDLVEAAGVDLFPPKSFYFNGRAGGVLFVYATPSDADVIAHIVGILHETGGGENLWLKSINHPTYLNRFPDNVAAAVSKDTADNRVDGIPWRAESALSQALAVEHKEAHEDYRVVLSARDTNSVHYEMRTFRINPTTFLPKLKSGVGYTGPFDGARDIDELSKEYFSQLGLNFDPPKKVYYNADQGMLFVYAPPKDLDVIEKATEELNYAPPMIHIKARFIEVPKSFLADTAHNYIPAGVTNGVGILPNHDFQTLWHELRSLEGTRELAEPEATTLSGRQTQMRATITESVVTNVIVVTSTPDGADVTTSVPRAMKVETGPTIDVVPAILADGYTIYLWVEASQTSLLRSPPRERPAAVQVSQASMSKRIYDGQTLVLFLKPAQGSSGGETNEAREKDGDKVLLTFVTATLIDSAGNRKHTDDELPFARKSVPVQSP